MSWNYRVINKGGIYGIHDVYYNSRGNIVSIGDNAVYPSGGSFEELRGDMGRLFSALGKPVLVYEEIEFDSMDDSDEIPEFDGHVKGTQCC
jgi:hypothetical protein